MFDPGNSATDQYMEKEIQSRNHENWSHSRLKFRYDLT